MKVLDIHRRNLSTKGYELEEKAIWSQLSISENDTESQRPQAPDPTKLQSGCNQKKNFLFLVSTALKEASQPKTKNRSPYPS